MTEVRDQIFDLIAKEAQIDRSRIALDSTLRDLEVDSLDAVQVIFAIEEQFQVYLPYNDPSVDTDTVGGLVATVERLLREKATA